MNPNLFFFQVFTSCDKVRRIIGKFCSGYYCKPMYPFSVSSMEYYLQT
ncbi:rCG28047 [Rattus norvegicus]|uniref:RCG28047 n=1 Tax=Rattus norvegicus TaxID=10116 RepID=A6IEW9_RAT|nr:rCG28047 [Rattus norvegicus]